MSELSLEETIKLLDIHVKYVSKLLDFYGGKQVKHRLPNYPEDISENLVKHLIANIEGISCSRQKKVGDLLTNENKRIEVKCYTSTGPSSFGPNEQWDVIYFLDAQNFINGEYKLYKVNLKNTDEKFRKIPMNKTETYGDQCEQKRRPRISFEELRKHITNEVCEIFNGNIHLHAEVVKAQKQQEEAQKHLEEAQKHLEEIKISDE